jgi:hypothetical protein
MVQTVQPLLAIDTPHVIHVDLQRLVFFGPTSLALLLAGLRRARDLGLNAKGSVIARPTAAGTGRYLERMNLLRVLVGERPEGFKRHDPVGFRPCQHFSGQHDYFLVASDLTDALREGCRVEGTAGSAVRVCLDEVCENVVDHADTELGGYAAAQGWPRARVPEFEIGIVDLGVGIRRSLTQNPKWAHIDTDAAAIEAALQPRVTATPERNSGIGLFLTSLLLAFNGGQLVVRSGAGAVTRSAKRTVETRPASLPGTLVALRARMDRPLDVASIYAMIDKLDEHRPGVPFGSPA